MMTEKKLTRSTSQKMLGGVCGGLGEYFNVDPVLVRLIFVILTLADGAGLLVYGLLWVLMPEHPATASAGSDGAQHASEKAAPFEPLGSRQG